MTKMIPLPVAGYTEQSQIRVDLVNHNKQLEEKVLRVIDELKQMDTMDQRWLAVAKTHIEQGFMALNRSIFQPQRIQGDLTL